MDQGQASGAPQHEEDEGDEVQAGQGFGQALVVPGQPSAARRPGEGAFDHPSARQEHEAALASGSLTTSRAIPCAAAASAAGAPV